MTALLNRNTQDRYRRPREREEREREGEREGGREGGRERGAERGTKCFCWCVHVNSKDTLPSKMQL